MRFSQHYSRETIEFVEQCINLRSSLQASMYEITNPYTTFYLPKGESGAQRKIMAPVPALKRVQSHILQQLLYKIPIPAHCHGFVPGRSILTHAQRHIGQAELINYDIEKAFPSVDRDRVVHVLHRYLGRELKHFGPRRDQQTRASAIELLTDFVTHENMLPQGAPTSGMLLNLALLDMDQKILDQCQRWRNEGFHGLRYTRYADDINLSSSEDLPGNAHEFLRTTINKSGFRYNGKKVHSSDSRLGQVLKICGLIIHDDHVKIPRKTLHRYRAILHSAACSQALTPEQRYEIAGVLGYVRMIYGLIPHSLRAPYEVLKARHGIKINWSKSQQKRAGYNLP